MEFLIGLTGPDFVVMAADTTSARSILTMKHDSNKMHPLNGKTLMGVVGEAGDAGQFAEFIGKNIQLYKYRNGYDLSPKAAAHYTRKNLADFLRSRTPYQVNLLMGGWDENDGPGLFFMDYLASMNQTPFAAHGYGSFFSMSILDRYYHPNITVQEAQDILQKCVDEVQARFLVNLPAFKVKIISKDGIKDLADLKPHAFQVPVQS